MANEDLISLYNYDEFIPAKFERWLKFKASPPVGEPAPDYPLWDLDGNQTRLNEIWSRYAYTIVEFGSFT
jgi:hypothetical protein